MLYVEILIGPETVNTMPDPTIEAFKDHGKVERTVDGDLDEARATMLRRLEDAGVDLDDVTHKLEVDGVKSFSDSFDSLIETIHGRLCPRGERGERKRRRPARMRAACGPTAAPGGQSAARRAAGGRRQRADAVHDLRRHRRPGPAQAAAGDLQPGRARASAGRSSRLVGYARTGMSDEGFRRFARAAIEAHSRTPMDERFWPAFASMIHYHAGGFDDDKHFHALGRTLRDLDDELGGGANRVFYLSTPASFFPVIIQRPGRRQAEPPVRAGAGR